MSAYLIDNPPAIRQFRERGTKPSGVMVVHTSEGAPDWVGPDTGAEGLARFIETRSTYGSYHGGVDSDSIVQLVPFHLQAYGDGTGSNPHATHGSVATQAAKWNAAPAEWRRESVRNLAEFFARGARWLKKEHGITVPARIITREESERRVPGFISHGARDPERRSDPGKDFPWAVFLQDFQEAMNPAATPNITDALELTGKAREDALRRVMRRGEPEAQEAATLWLRGLTQRRKGLDKIERAKKDLRALEVRK
jgi:hypothetical protein